MNRLIKKPSAWLPIAMSLAALLLIVGVVSIYGLAEQKAQTDEGTAAHLFQLLIGLQVPIIAFFMIKWLPQMPKQTLLLLALQVFAALVPLATIFILEL